MHPVRYTGSVEEPDQPSMKGQQPPGDQPAPGQRGQSKPNNDPEFLRNIEAKLRAIPAWLMIVGALALGLAVGGIGYLLRGALDALFGNTL